METDSLILARCFTLGRKVPWALLDIWMDIKQLCEVIHVYVSHVFREGNKLADTLAKIGSMGINAFYASEMDLPKYAFGIWKMDKLGFSNFRQPR